MRKYCDDKNIGEMINLSSKNVSLIGDIVVDEDVYLYRPSSDKATLETYITICDTELMSQVLKISHCPMCGRKLSDAEF